MSQQSVRSQRSVGSQRSVLLAGVICAVGYLLTSPVGDVGPLHDLYRGRQILVKLLQWAFFAVGLWILRGGFLRGAVLRGGNLSGGSVRAAGEPTGLRRRRPVSLGLIVLIAFGCQLPGLLVPPQSSSDAYRYVLDGRVQRAGTSPYRYVPLDDHLARFRDPVLFPGLTPQQSSGVTTPAKIPTDPARVAALTQPDPRTVINRPGVPTIYPPVAEAWFAAAAAVTPWTAGTRGLQWGAALIALAITAGIGLALRRRGHDVVPAVYWGWSPLGVLDTGNGAHVDVLAAGFIVAALLVLDGRGRPGLAGPDPDELGTSQLSVRRRITGGVLLGLAIATKILPLLLLPAVTLLRRRSGGAVKGVLTPVTAVTTAALSYLPHILVAGSLVLGYLPGYLTEEGFSDGSKRYSGLAVFLPQSVCGPVGIGLMLILALVVLARATPERPELLALWLYGGSLLISTPEYPWYCLPLLALAALARRPEWLAVVIATQWAYIDVHSSHSVGIGYVVAAVVVIAVNVRRTLTVTRVARDRVSARLAPV